MKGQTIGYIRVSSFDQNEGRQLEQENLDRVFTDKASGKDTNRPQLQELLQFVREGDIVLVHSMDRLARDLDDLRRLVKTLTAQGVSIRFIKEGLTFNSEEDSPMSNLLLSVMGAFAEFERSLINERQQEGIELAKKKGIYKGRKRSLTDEQIDTLKHRAKAGNKKSELANEYGISRQTVYSYLQI
jgi:DNA invertase Pin-like site-specific DNA recombinase